MQQQKNILVLDTETCDLQGWVYDVGYVITNKRGDVLDTFNALVEEVFTDAEKMMGAFYARKLFTHYAPMLDRGDVRIMPWQSIVDRLRADFNAYDINLVSAYNLGFDMRVMRQTNDLFGDGKPVLPAKPELLDIWQFACEAKLNTRTYKKLAHEMGWVSAAGNIRTGAEYAYRFCAGDWGFIESHTALDDALIETRILASCYAAKKRVPYGIFNKAPWRLVNA